MKTSIYINRKVKNPDTSKESPNHIGKIVEHKKMYRGLNIYNVKFRDFEEWWNLSYVKKNLT